MKKDEYELRVKVARETSRLFSSAIHNVLIEQNKIDKRNKKIIMIIVILLVFSILLFYVFAALVSLKWL